MATYQDPVKCFAPLEVIERLLEIRAEMGYEQVVYVPSSAELADFFDAHGIDVYALSSEDTAINFGDYSSALVPGGYNAHESMTTH